MLRKCDVFGDVQVQILDICANIQLDAACSESKEIVSYRMEMNKTEILPPL